MTSLAEVGSSDSSVSGWSSGFVVAFAGLEAPGVDPGAMPFVPLAPLKLVNWK